jgi:hypothetical protein
MLLIAALIALAGAANGVMDTLQFHYDRQTVFAQNDRYWNPAISWQNKYAQATPWELAKPLRPKFPGSITVFVAITDGWHLMKFIYQGALRTAIVLLFAAAVKLRWARLYRLAFWLAAWLALAALQSAGFHVTYTIIF